MKRVIVVFLVSVMALLGSCAQSDNRTTSNYDDFIQSLTENGFQYSEEEPDTDSFLSVARRPLWIGDDIISVYEYESNSAMEADAACIDKSGFSIDLPDRGAKISWVSNPYFFKKDKMIINYVGVNEQILVFLGESFGKPFAGHTG